MRAHDVRPGRGEGILEIGHEARCARVERVDHHLAIGRPGDLDVPLRERGRRRRDGPVARADAGRFREEPGPLAGIERGLAGGARLEQPKPRWVERAVEARHERQRDWRQDPRRIRLCFAGDLDLPHGFRHVGHDGLPRSRSGHGTTN